MRASSKTLSALIGVAQAESVLVRGAVIVGGTLLTWGMGQRDAIRTTTALVYEMDESQFRDPGWLTEALLLSRSAACIREGSRLSSKVVQVDSDMSFRRKRQRAIAAAPSPTIRRMIVLGSGTGASKEASNK